MSKKSKQELKQQEEVKSTAVVEKDQTNLGFVRIPVDDIELWDENPQEEDADTFNMLVQEIKDDNPNPDDMDQPLIVVKHPTKDGKFIVMSGNHRLKGLKLLAAKSAICRVKDWDLKTATEKAIRRNLTTGRLNEAKFTKLVNSYSRRHGVDVADVAPKFGFQKESEFWKNYKRQKDKALENAEKTAKQKSREELNKIDNLSFLLNKLFREFGDTLEYEFMFFNYGGKLHVMVQMDEQLKDMIGKIATFSQENKVDINQVLRRIMGPGIEGLEEIAAELKNG